MNVKDKTIIKCLTCKKEFQTYPYLLRKGFGTHCSKKCASVHNTGVIKPGQRLSKSTEFKKGQTPWNYKGDFVGYKCLHDWVKNNLGKPQACSNPECRSKSNIFEWANKSGEYKRDLSDWLRLCRSCHRSYDNQRRKNVSSV